MRAKIAILVLLILLAQTLSFAHAGPTDELSWSKDHDEMISTSPLILADSIVVKTTDGLISILLHSGEELWTWNPSQALLFEISPLYHHEPTSLIVTGWTDGQVTAHQPGDGELVMVHLNRFTDVGDHRQNSRISRICIVVPSRDRTVVD
ncbi:MAG: hypothetical protein ACJZ59_07275 [Candidatus Thalassarchaeaceae archaeon]